MCLPAYVSVCVQASNTVANLFVAWSMAYNMNYTSLNQVGGGNS